MHHMNVQGRAIKRGWLFACLPLPPLGGWEGQYKQNPIGGDPSDRLHGGEGGEQSVCHQGDHLKLTQRSELCAGENNSKIAAGLSINGSFVFKMKKFLDDSLELPLWRKDWKNRS
jgi:hypothetical protein